MSLLSIAGDFARPGAVRAAAETVAVLDPQIVSLHGTEPGDALALSTRLARAYAYRGAQALLWKPSFAAHEVQDRYLPAMPLRPFDRRGILHVHGTFADAALSLVATQFSDEREAYVRELRFARRVLRTIAGAAVLFAGGVSARVLRIGFADLGFGELQIEGGTLVAARGLSAQASILRV